jgi:hypothetical protein
MMNTATCRTLAFLGTLLFATDTYTVSEVLTCTALGVDGAWGALEELERLGFAAWSRLTDGTGEWVSAGDGRSELAYPSRG